jgi:hypothetical protein
MILFIISLSLFLLSIVGIQLVNNFITKRGKNFGDTWKGPICVLTLLVSLVIGLVAIPLLRTYKIEYKEIINYQILKSPDAIVIDLTNSNSDISDFSNNLIKYNSYRAVTEFSDSTKIFERIERSFYGNTLFQSWVWSNPPYKYFNQE